MGKQGDEGDEEGAAGVYADGVGRLFLEGCGALLDGLDELEHGAG